MEKNDYRELIKGNIPPWIFRFVKACGRTVNKYDMIRDGEKVLLSVSGGKDSLVMALALSLRLKWLPVKYTLSAVLIDWKEHPLSLQSLDLMRKYFSDLGIDLRIVGEDMYSEGFKDDFNCYLCSRNRRRILFDIADKEGFSLIATGHHLDDIVETTLMNISCRGHFESMNPVQNFFDGKISIIRPLSEIHESTIQRIADSYTIPVAKCVCPHENIRSEIKPVVSSLVKINKLAREHIYMSHDFSCVPKRAE